MLKIRVKIQESTAVGSLNDDDGEFVFMVGKRGLEEYFDMTFFPGQEILIGVDMKFLEFLQLKRKDSTCRSETTKT